MARSRAWACWRIARAARSQHHDGWLDPRLDRKLCVLDWDYAWHALSEAFLRRHRLARRQPRSICRCGRAVYAGRFRLRDPRNPLERRTDLCPRVVGAGALDCGNRTYVLVDPPLGGDGIFEPVLFGASSDGPVSLRSLW